LVKSNSGNVSTSADAVSLFCAQAFSPGSRHSYDAGSRSASIPASSPREIAYRIEIALTAGVLGALGGIASFVGTTTIIPFMPGGWAASAGGFPAMTERVAFLMKDFVLLAVFFYLLKQDLLRLSLVQDRASSGVEELIRSR